MCTVWSVVICLKVLNLHFWKKWIKQYTGSSESLANLSSGLFFNILKTIFDVLMFAFQLHSNTVFWMAYADKRLALMYKSKRSKNQISKHRYLIPLKYRLTKKEQRPCVSDYHHIKSIRNFDCISFHQLGWKLRNVGKNCVKYTEEFNATRQQLVQIFMCIWFSVVPMQTIDMLLFKTRTHFYCFLYIPPSYICLTAVLLLTVGITNDTRMRVIMHTQTIQC